MSVSRHLTTILFLAFYVPNGDSFLINHKGRLPEIVGQSVMATHVPSGIVTRTFAKDGDESNDARTYVYGNDRGNVILAIVMTFCVWQFSIPPSFRRAHICYSDACIEQRSACSDCVTVQEWTNDVTDYYRNGGGVQWDFSIDPRTMEQNQQKWDEVFSKK